MTNQPVDPFAGGDSNPSLSFKDAPIGTTYQGVVAELPTLMQGRDFDTGNPDFWPDGNPKMVVCTTLEISGDKWSLWAGKPSGMFAAIKAAQEVAGAQIAVGGTLTVQLVGEKPNPEKPRLNPQKVYHVTYTPPNAFGEQQPASAPVQQPAPPVAPPIQQPAQQAQQPVFQPPAQQPVYQQPVQQPVAAPAAQQPVLQAVPNPAPVPVQGALAPQPTAYAQPTPEAVQAAINAGLDPATIFPGYQPPV